MKMIEGGIYKHYKGKHYRFHRVVRHSESLEEMGLYETLYQNELGVYWVRPLAMFFETVEVDGKVIPRFTYVGTEIA